MRDTSTGAFYEHIIERVLDQCGLVNGGQQYVGVTPSGKRHRVDYVAWNPDDPSRKVLISCKSQSVGGTAEEKLPYEVIKLLHAMDTNAEYVAAYIIIGGTGWSRPLIEWMKGGLATYVPEAPRVRIYTTDELITKRIQIL